MAPVRGNFRTRVLDGSAEDMKFLRSNGKLA